MDAQWQAPGVKFSGHGVAYMGTCLKDMQVRGGSARNPQPDKETKRRRAGLAMYNEKLKPIILAEATRDDRFSLPRYSWPKEAEAAPAAAPAVESVPRKRIPKAKLEQAAAIIAKVPQDELATFLAKFGLSLSLAASIASLDNAEMIARQFLRATL
jgi:hypothetical protein